MDFGQDLLGQCLPSAAFRTIVVVLDIFEDGLLQLADAFERASPQTFLREDSKRSARCGNSFVPLLGTQFFWNAMRFRETVMYYHQLDPAIFARRLANLVPADAPATGTPELFLVARQGGLRYVPLPWYRQQVEVPAESWIVLSKRDRDRGDRVAPANLAARELIFEGNAFPDANLLEFPFAVFRPMHARP